eukprot:4983718-Pyramimonas_sp.AAC.1
MGSNWVGSRLGPPLGQGIREFVATGASRVLASAHVGISIQMREDSVQADILAPPLLEGRPNSGPPFGVASPGILSIPLDPAVKDQLAV